MWSLDSHLSDQQLLLDVEGERSPRNEKRIREHLEACWKCRARRQEFESAIAQFMRVHERGQDVELPPSAGPRALLKAHLAQLSAVEPNRRAPGFSSPRGMAGAWAACGFLCALLALGFVFSRSAVGLRQRGRMAVVSVPDSRLTPGAALLESRPAVCSQSNTNNKVVPAVLQRQVFEEYGIAGAEPRAYEVDYLITPALGGADDIHNLWPHSYSATVWNAQVKDALEVRLRQMVCDGSLDLSEAQQEIATNWIAAYKKYFHTDKPLSDH